MKTVFRMVAAQPSVELYERAKAYSQFRRLEPELSGARELESRERVWADCLTRLDVDAPCLYLEFGVYEGASMAYFSDHLRHVDTRLFGFDSFEGLPEVWGPNPKGTFTTNGSVPRFVDHRVQFVKGWFHETLPGFLQRPDVARMLANPKFNVFVHLDADLYSSTLFVLTTLWHHVRDYYFCFDEFMGHELRALQDFRSAYPALVSFYAYDLETGFPTRLSGHLKNQRRQSIGRPS